MQVVIFEVILKVGQKPTYLDIAARLRPMLQEIDGFISIERFQSLNDPEKLLSLSYWRDARAVEEWRKQSQHRDAQHQGNQDIFRDYRITVADTLRSYGKTDRDEAPG